MPPVITMFCAFTRDWAVDRWIDNLIKLNYPRDLINLCFIVDCDEPAIAGKLMAVADKGQYRSSKTVINGDWSPNEVRIAVRRQRIADVKNQSKQLIEASDGDIIVSFEDDTVFSRLDINRLLNPFRNDESLGFVQGVQCGRWGVRMIGAWSVDDYEFPTKVKTLLPTEVTKDIYEYIDAGGFYGYATRRDLYLEHDYNWDNTPWGPDVNYGLWLRNRAYKCLIDWRSEFGHDDHGTVAWPNEGLEQIVYTKDPANGEWRRQDEAASSHKRNRSS